MSFAEEHAVVIGAGVAGLAAAQALAGRFGRVTLIERDTLPGEPQTRRGVPQGSHGHVLLAAGQAALTELFPGFADALVAAGAVPFDPGLDLRMHRFGALWPRVASGLRLVSFSRPLLEQTLRDRLLPNVEVRDGVAVSGLTGSGRVDGVRLDTGEVLTASLVADCSGRGSRSDRWLGDLGFPSPEPAEVKVGVGYATRVYPRKPDDVTDGEAVFAFPMPPHANLTGLLLPIEGDRWLVMAGAWHGAYPRDEEGFARHLAAMPHPAFADLASRAEPLSEVFVHAFPASRRRYFEKLDRHPAGYVTLGEALCSFNPIYGQGMTCAALEAVELGSLLDKHGSVSARLATEYYRRAAGILAVPWRFAAGGDFAFPETTGPKPPLIDLLNRYSKRMLLAAMRDAEVRVTFNRVQHLVLPPSVLFKPRMVWKVLRATRRVAQRPQQ
ncbi:FAD-dependent oxidoreductase [Hamadaea sp. NPDC051192]|uniref:FAD-dependent oxidoreductase n=1 Tax=Hamadaea sp. NPDC051192 TaxID=3154940 RepID=UPI0034258DD7